jgi:hypothetical protein
MKKKWIYSYQYVNMSDGKKERRVFIALALLKQVMCSLS